MEVKFSFLCGTFEKSNYVYAVKLRNLPWHYFEEEDSYINVHQSLPASMDSLIRQLNKVKSIDVNLNEKQIQTYYKDGKFVFNNKELKTYMNLKCKPKEPVESQSSTKRLLFISGQTNPLSFLKKFEQCNDVKTDKDKMYRIRHFVDEIHKAEFTKLYFESNWMDVRTAFLKIYSLPFVQNKKQNLGLEYEYSTSLRSFVGRKLENLAKYTTLPFVNQVEIVMNDLPVEISTMFITEEKMTGSKEMILEFCDTIQELVGIMEGGNSIENPSNDMVEPLKRLEIFTSNSEVELSESSNEPGSSKGVRRRAMAIKRPSKRLKPIQESDASSDYDFSAEKDASSRSSWSN